MTRVLVVDDHPVVLAGLTAMIDANDDLEVVGSATTVAGALALPVDLGPDLCVLDLQLPDGDGISLGIAAKQRWPGTRVLVLTMSAEPAAVMRSLSADLDGYVMKDADPGELLAAIRSAAAGAVVLGRGASRTIIAAAVALPVIEPLAALDARDREILDLLVRASTPTRSPGSSSSPRRPSATASRTSSASSASPTGTRRSPWAAPAASATEARRSRHRPTVRGQRSARPGFRDVADVRARLHLLRIRRRSADGPYGGVAQGGSSRACER